MNRETGKPTGYKEDQIDPRLTNSGPVIRTDTEKVRASQAQQLEYLLLNHPLDCSICDQAGECYLQDYTYKFGNAHSRLHEPKVQRVDKYHIGDEIALFTDRCVMCTRCVRFTREYSGTSELQVISRGSVEEIDVFPGEPCNNKLAGNVVDLCPVGALCSKDFLYEQRVWWLKSKKSVCQDCSTGCSRCWNSWRWREGPIPWAPSRSCWPTNTGSSLRPTPQRTGRCRRLR